MTEKDRPTRTDSGKKETCVINDCNSEVKARGLCYSCYTAAKDHIGKTDLTWADLEKRGLARPDGRKQPAKISSALKELSAKGEQTSA